LTRSRGGEKKENKIIKTSRVPVSSALQREKSARAIGRKVAEEDGREGYDSDYKTAG